MELHPLESFYPRWDQPAKQDCDEYCHQDAHPSRCPDVGCKNSCTLNTICIASREEEGLGLLYFVAFNPPKEGKLTSCVSTLHLSCNKGVKKCQYAISSKSPNQSAGCQYARSHHLPNRQMSCNVAHHIHRNNSDCRCHHSLRLIARGCHALEIVSIQYRAFYKLQIDVWQSREKSTWLIRAFEHDPHPLLDLSIYIH